MDPSTVEAVLADPRAAPIGAGLRAMLLYLEKVTLDPEAVGPDDAAALRAAGLGDDAIADAVHVCALFNIYDRLADAMGWDVPGDPRYWTVQARMLLSRGYGG